ncbi:MAG: YafY family protein [Cyclobacteriaceae bacterium]
MAYQDTPRLSRLTAILTQLQSKRIMTAREIAEKYGVSIRTVYRDIRTLEQAGIPIVTEEGKGYSLVEGFMLPPAMFSEEEANALLTAEQLVAKNKDTSFVAHYREAMTKIKAVLRYTTKEKADLLSQRIDFRLNSAQDASSNHLSSIQLALTNFRVVNIQYRALSEEVTRRSVEPFALYNTQENWIMIAKCQLRQDFRSFRLDRIQAMNITEKTFAPHSLSLPEYFEQCRKKFSNHP